MIKILLADDQYLILEGIKTILKHEPEIEVVGTAQDGRSAIAQTKKLRPDILLIDIEMPEMNGISATKYICKYLPNTRVIVLTSHKCQDYIAQALQAGASGYLLKDSLVKDLKQTIFSFGMSYAETKAKLLTKAVNKIRTTNVIGYQEKITYLKEHRKSIYKPTLIRKSKLVSSRTSNRQSADIGITKASLEPIFEPYSTPEILPNLKVSSPRSKSILSSPKSNRRKYLKIIIWLLLVIASFVLAIIIF